MQKQTEQGMSLIEVIMGMFIAIIIMTACVPLLGVSLGSLQYNLGQQRNEMESRRVLNQMADELRNASAITQPAFVAQQSPPNSATAIEYIVNGEQRSLALGKKEEAQTLFLTKTTKDGTQSTKLAANLVQSILFSRDSTLENKIVIQLSLQDTANPAKNGMVVSTTVMVNNLKPSQL